MSMWMILRAVILGTILFRGPGERECLLICPAFVFLRNGMQREMRARLDALPRTEASLIEPMERLSASKLLGSIQLTAHSTTMPSRPPHWFFPSYEGRTRPNVIQKVTEEFS